MTRIIFILFLLYLSPIRISAQGEWNNWYFGWYAAMTFNSGSPVPVLTSAMNESGMSVGASVSDSLGHLLFYSDGMRVYDSTNNIMPHGSGLLGGTPLGYGQSVIAVQNLTNKNQYYLFTVGTYGNTTGPVGLYYSIVDMTLNGGQGDIVSGQRNIPVIAGDSAIVQLTAIRHSNNKYGWIVVLNHGQTSDYQAYLIDSSGFHTTPVSSPNHINAHINNISHPFSNIRISPDGRNLVCTDSLTQLCYFNASTGIVTPRFTFYTDYSSNGVPKEWGKEFSINSRYLYITNIYNYNQDSITYIYQYDMNAADSLSFVQSKQEIGHGSGVNIQMAPDGKIYIDTRGSTDSLCVVNNPSLGGLLCNYQQNAFYSVNSPNGCLPQFLQKYKAYINHIGSCQNNPIHFFSDIWPPADSIHWDFGDPGSGTSNYSNLQSSLHTYSQTGTYTVELFVRHIDNRTDTSWQNITIVASPQVNLGPNRTICIGDSTTFDAGFCNGCTYQWKNLGTGLIVGTNQTYKTGLADNYSVAVTNTNNCTGADTVQLFTTPVPAVTNNPLSETICSGDSTYIVLTSSVPGTMFHWTANLTSGNITGFSADSGLILNQTLIDNLPTNGVVTYHITPKVGSCVGTTVAYQVTVTPGVPVSVSISASQNNVCAGTSITFTAVPTNGGSNPLYQWKVNGTNSGTNSSTFTYTPVNNDVVTCVLTSSIMACISNNPATSNAITMTVNPESAGKYHSITIPESGLCGNNSHIYGKSNQWRS